jgi:predicted ATPase
MGRTGSGTQKLMILTGAPGTGKTAILDRLSAVFSGMSEPAREVLAEQRAVGGEGTPDRDAGLFVQLLLRRSIDKYEAALRSGSPTLFDRGIPDCVAYAVILGVDPTSAVQAADRYRYRDEVFSLEPWEEIYATDEERTMSFDDTLLFHSALVEAYDHADYGLTSVPKGAVGERVAFIRDRIRARDHS